MTDTKKRRKLSHEILGLLAAALAVSFFLMEFLYLTALGISHHYIEVNDLLLNEEQYITLDGWLLNLSLLVTLLFFLVLFLILLGQKLSYVRTLTQGVEALRANRMDYEMPLEGSNELTQLAETINYLSATQRAVQEKERALAQEKEQLIRTLSHDIRTPLTSILSYSELLQAQEDCDPQEIRTHLALIQKKAGQIKELTDILLDGGKRNPEPFENARFLLEQLAAEAEEALEEDFPVEIDLSQCPPFQGTFDLRELQRIFDNLVSNIQKYADPARPVVFRLALVDGSLVITQENGKGTRQSPAESHQMGLNSIRRIAHSYGGTVEVREDETAFAISVVLSEF
ncbi:MAG: HAMP domain-containing histidine kinase [Ruminiclostridium sp.]|nr:HAMP domain-containing histidine kinase [Ruminiclostridium sp.]